MLTSFPTKSRTFSSALDHHPIASTHSLKRKQALALGRPYDNAGYITTTVDENFKLSNTIFKSLPEGSLLAKVQTTKLNTVIDWDPTSMKTIEEDYANVKLPPSGDEALHQFMFNECHFDSEHADGSFFEHLHFCRDFTALHYPSGSPRVMLLHSICG